MWDETIWLSYFVQTTDATTRARLQSLIDSKRLEIIGGGWVMHDEAVSSLYSVVNQLAVGISFVKDKFNTRPRFQWHIDPFGHSATSPIVFAGLGYSGFVINRVPNDVKFQRRATKTLEFLWDGLDVPLANNDSLIFAHLLDSHYDPPSLNGSTIEEKAESFVNMCHMKAAWYNTTNVMIPWGNDFDYINASFDCKYAACD